MRYPVSVGMHTGTIMIGSLITFDMRGQLAPLSSQMPRRRRESDGCAAALRQRQGRHRTVVIALLANKMQAWAGRSASVADIGCCHLDLGASRRHKRFAATRQNSDQSLWVSCGVKPPVRYVAALRAFVVAG